MKLTVIGGGPGGYESAIYAAKKGAEVTLVEKKDVGGTCLNVGCIPTKALLASSNAMQTIRKAYDYGIRTSNETVVDYASVVARKNRVVTGVVKGVRQTLAANGVRLIEGTGYLKDTKTVTVTLNTGGEENLISDAILLATGATATVPSFLDVDEERVLTSTGVLGLQQNPSSLTILGGGIIGCEIGQFLARMGTKVTIVEMMPRLLSTEDEDVSAAIERQFRRDKIKVLCGKRITNVVKTAQGVQMQLEDGGVLESEALMVSVGRKPCTAGLGLEKVGVQTGEKGFVVVDGSMATTAKGIYAIGDIVSSPQLAHVASKEGFCAVDAMLGESCESMDYKAVPRCVYTHPEVACVGRTEEELRQLDIPFQKGTFAFASSGKAKADGKTDGFVKVLTDEEDVVCGAALVGGHATEMLSVLTLAVSAGMTARQVGDIIFPHPTMSEAIKEALHDIHSMSIHNLPR